MLRDCEVVKCGSLVISFKTYSIVVIRFIYNLNISPRNLKVVVRIFIVKNEMNHITENPRLTILQFPKQKLNPLKLP